MKRAIFLLFVVALIALLAFVFLNFSQTPHESVINKDGMPKDSLLLVPWNVRDFGKTKTPETLAFMANILRDADIVVILEVSTGDAGASTLAKLADELNRKGAKWDYIPSDPTIGPGTERYGFLWNTSSVWVNRDDIKLAKSLQNLLDREPAIMTFHAGKKKFSIASFHLQPDDKSSGKNPRVEVNAIGQNPAELSSGSMIFVGDFNLSHRELDPVFEGMLKMKHNIEGKTSLKMKLDKKGKYLMRDYDNIYTRGVTVHKAAIYDFVPLAGDLEKARKVSDHLPVYIVFTPE